MSHILNMVSRLPSRLGKNSHYHAPLSPVLRQAVMVVFLFAWVAAIFALFPLPGLVSYGARSEGLMLAAALILALLSLARYLPWQNILTLGIVIGIIAGGAFGGVAHHTFPGQPLSYAAELGPKLFNGLAWVVLPIWGVIFLTAHGVAKLILHPFRNRLNFGILLIGSTVTLVGIMALGLEPFAVQVKHYWAWRMLGGAQVWPGIPWLALVLWMGVALLIELLGTPWLISKKPISPPPDFYPLVLWFFIHLWIIAGCSTRGLLVEAAVSLGWLALVVPLAVWGGIGSRKA